MNTYKVTFEEGEKFWYIRTPLSYMEIIKIMVNGVREGTVNIDPKTNEIIPYSIWLIYPDTPTKTPIHIDSNVHVFDKALFDQDINNGWRYV